MKHLRMIVVIAVCISCSLPAMAQFGMQQELLPGQLSAQEDHQRTLELLGLESIRPGAEGMNQDAPNYANYDESKANPYPDLPELMVTNDGRTVDSAELWWRVRRPEIVELFDREIYGRVPENTPDVAWEVIETWVDSVGTIPVLNKHLVGRVDNSSHPDITVEIDFSVSTPLNAPGPVPVMMEFGGAKRQPNPDQEAGQGRRGFGFGFGGGTSSWQQQCIEKGWGYAGISANSIQADNGAGLTLGIIGLCNKGEPRDLDDWGALRAWAWGASRALDYLETDRNVDAGQVGIEGVSRYGKAAIVTLAYDQRFAAGLVASSGEGGASLYRRNWGELVENVAATNEYHWMAGNFLKYAADPLTWDDMPIDTHMLVALCAPRICFLSASTVEAGDGWVDSRGTFMAGAAAAPVWPLLGARDMGTTDYPPTGTPLVYGQLAFRQHTDGHTAGSNWGYFIDLCEKYGFETYKNGQGHADEPLPQAGTQVFYEKHTELMELAQTTDIDLIVIGDSITRRWKATHEESWNKNFGGWNAADYGSGMDNTRNMIWRITHGELDGVNPKVIAMLIGTNNVGFRPIRGNDDLLVFETAMGIGAAIDIMQEKAPGVKIILTAITPRNTNGSPDVMPTVNRINERIARYADGEDVVFIDITDQMADENGILFDGVTEDGLHVSNEGYQIWADAMMPYLEEWLGPRE